MQGQSVISPDIIDRLDDILRYPYHHEGPYDPVYSERNCSKSTSPLEALAYSNGQALIATPPEKVRDCLDKHHPLDGVAFYPAGKADPTGHTYLYDEAVASILNGCLLGNVPVSFHLRDCISSGLIEQCSKFTDEDFLNDPFYILPHPRPVQSACEKGWSKLRLKLAEISRKKRHDKMLSVNNSRKMQTERC